MLSWLHHKKHRPSESATEEQCSFCSKSSSKRLFAGPGNVRICNECIEVCEEILEDDVKLPREAQSADMYADLICSFCLKPGNEVQRLIAGPSVYICGDCAMRFRQIAD